MRRMYESDEITVFWNSDKCQHARMCVTGNPRVFEFGRRPWIDLNKGQTPGIWQTVEKCPSGALTITYNHGITVRFDEASCSSIAYDGSAIVGKCEYEETPQGWMICHTNVLPDYGGKGIAKRLVYAVLQAADQQKTAVTSVCSYATKVMGES